MSRARDNANKLSGGETIKVETENVLECRVPHAETNISGLMVKNQDDECIFTVEESGRLLQQYYPPADNLSGGPGVYLVSDKGGFRVLRGPLLETTDDGGITWRHCCGEKAVPPPPPIEIPPEQAILVELKSVSARWKNAIGTSRVTYVPDTDDFTNNPLVKWGSLRDISNQTSRYRYDCVDPVNNDVDPPTYTIISPDTNIEFGNLTHINFPTGGGTITQVDLELNIDLDVIYTLNRIIKRYEFNDVKFDFRFKHEETANYRNAASCKYQVTENSPNPCADKVDIVASPSGNVLEFGDGVGSITLSLVGFAHTEQDIIDENFTTSWFTGEYKENPAITVGRYTLQHGEKWNMIDDGDYIPIDPNDPTDPSPDVIIGEDENGNSVTEYDELNGLFTGTLYIPSLSDHHTIVYPAGGRETVYPACAGVEIEDVFDFYDCRSSLESLKPNITISQRLPIVNTLPEPRVEMKTRETQDQLANYDFSISKYPGNLLTECASKNLHESHFYFIDNPLYCDMVFENLGDNKIKMYYANFRPAGPEAYRCGDDLICAMYVRGWKTSGPWGEEGEQPDDDDS